MPNTTETKKSADTKTYTGSCHCGAVRFEAQLDMSAPVRRCNCTSCTKVSASTQIVTPSGLRVTAGADQLTQYQREGSPNYRAFCKQCGVQLFGGGYVEQIGGDYRSININCLDDVDPATLATLHWDGRHDNWQAGPRSAPWPVRA